MEWRKNSFSVFMTSVFLIQQSQGASTRTRTHTHTHARFHPGTSPAPCISSTRGESDLSVRAGTEVQMGPCRIVSLFSEASALPQAVDGTFLGPLSLHLQGAGVLEPTPPPRASQDCKSALPPPLVQGHPRSQGSCCLASALAS